MNRLKLLATATLMALTFTACDEGTPPPVEPPPPPTPVGTISGTVTIEGTAASGITATLSSGATTTTGSGGSFAFSGVEAGTYTVTISGFPEDATFAQVTQSATIATDGQNVQLNFAGEYIRSSAVVGNVVAADAMMSGGDGQPETLAGVTVTLGGEHAMGETMETDMSGGFAFTGLRAGTYTVTISDFPEDVSFEEVSLEISVEVGEVGQADFTGHFIRTSAVEGQVIIEGEGLAGVTVTLNGGPADESYTMMTDADGMYRFEELRPGDYTVSISDFDTRDYEFAATSQDVSVDLDETGTVSFTGVLLRTSGIAGRVSVEGMGLGGIEVTLSGGEEAQTAMTDDGGQYNFAGLAAGDYTVSISVESDAYVFESMSSDVTVGDDESKIVNFEGMHARTASVSGMVFLDEATKNDMHDEGEHPLAHAGIPVALVGPGVNEQRLGATDATGAFSFSGLRSGPYQLVVLIDATVAAALAANDVAYGGPATGYEIALGVGEAASQGIPFDITHTTVNFTVMLKHGDDTGAAVPGASVTLYNSAGDDKRKVGSGDTGDDGSAATIKVARGYTSGNMVHASVSADGYSGDGMTAVSWDPQMFATAASNSHDLVNLSVDATVSGATITTDYGGGKALAGWAISVMHGDDAVDGAAEMLDDDGNAALMTTVTADDLPATYTFAVADDQDDKLDGGENFSATTVEYMHTGLALAGTMDAGTMEVSYTTQTLKVYVHNEKDQVMGYTGNLLGGDERDDGQVSVGIRYIDGSGRSRAFTTADSIETPKGNGGKGVWTFSNVPADENVIVQADKATGVTDIKLLDPDELAAYTDMEANGITGGAFGAMGGFNHTVELCPLQATTPQDHGECASFAYVNTYTVDGQVWKKGVKKDGDDFKEEDEVTVAGLTVSLSPVDGKNLAGEEASYTTAEKDNTKTDLNEKMEFNLAGVAAGAYTLGLPDGWRARIPDDDDDLGDDSPKGATGMVGNALNPIAGAVSLDVTPATATVYGRVDGSDGFPLDSVTVTVNGMSAMTDNHGRYIIEGISAVRSKVFVSASRAGYNVARTDSTTIDFAANSLTEHDIDLAGVQARATFSGKVISSTGGAAIAGVEIRVDGKAPSNAPTSGANRGKLLTGADGTFMAEAPAKTLGKTSDVSAHKDGWTFVPAKYPAAAHPGATTPSITFSGFVNATVTGRVAAPGGGPLKDVVIEARPASDPDADDPVDADTTGVTGTFSLSVSGVGGSYGLTATLAGHTFEIPTQYREVVNVAPGQTVNIGTIQAMSAGALKVSAKRDRVEDEASTTDVDESEQRWAATISGSFTANDEHVPDEYTSPATYVVWHDAGGDSTNVGAPTESTTAGEEGMYTFEFATPAIGDGGDGAFKVWVVATATHTGAGDALIISSDRGNVVAVDPSATDVKTRRQASATANAASASGDFIQASWTAVTNTNSSFRLVAQVTATDFGANPVWVVLSTAPALESTSRSAISVEIDDDYTVEASVATPYGTGSAGTVTAADLRKAISIAVESVQGTADDEEDGPKWKRSRGTSSQQESGPLAANNPSTPSVWLARHQPG